MIAILKYRAGNIASVQNALNRLGAESVLTDDPETIRKAERVIFPGVGEASTAMEDLRNKGLDQVIRTLTQPFLGICLGMQLMATHSEEGDTDCLNLFSGQVRAFTQTTRRIHMGWNNLNCLDQHPLVAALPSDPDLYFVHGYYLESCASTKVTAQFESQPFTAIAQKDNFYGVQFHPEKSGKYGQQILQNFLSL